MSSKLIIKFKLLLLVFFVSILTAATFYLFESFVARGIHYVWNELFHLDERFWIVIPVTIILSLCFFAAKHYLDSEESEKETKGFEDEKVKVTFKNYITILFVGFLSLLAGASMGPEAILVPACLIIGLYVSKKVVPGNKEISGLLAGASIIALFAAFFHSFWVGLLSLFLVLVKSQKKVKVFLVLVAIIASITSIITLNFFHPGESIFSSFEPMLGIGVKEIMIIVSLIPVGYLLTWIIRWLYDGLVIVRDKLQSKAWWQKGLCAGLGLGIVYFVGGPLTQFTGSEAINPMFEQAQILGFLGLVSILVFKIIAIGWSKAFWYRGGLIFPIIFAASTIIALVSLITGIINFWYFLIALITGVLLAEKKAKILFH